MGYFQRKEFPLSTIKNPSLRFRRLWEELEARFPNNPYVEGHGYESGSPATIVVWDRPDRLPDWERIIKAHDSAPTIIVDGSQREYNGLSAFLGYWANGEGEVCYIIAEDAEGNVEVRTPPNKAWRTVLRNIRLEGRKLLFDQFNYPDPNEAYKSDVDIPSEHPFSGVRCETSLEVNLKNPDELFERMSTFYFTDPNHDVLKKLR